MFFSYTPCKCICHMVLTVLQTACAFQKLDPFPQHHILFQILDYEENLETYYSKSCNIQRLMIHEDPYIRNCLRRSQNITISSTSRKKIFTGQIYINKSHIKMYRQPFVVNMMIKRIKYWYLVGVSCCIHTLCYISSNEKERNKQVCREAIQDFEWQIKCLSLYITLLGTLRYSLCTML